MLIGGGGGFLCVELTLVGKPYILVNFYASISPNHGSLFSFLFARQPFSLIVVSNYNTPLQPTLHKSGKPTQKMAL